MGMKRERIQKAYEMAKKNNFTILNINQKSKIITMKCNVHRNIFNQNIKLLIRGTNACVMCQKEIFLNKVWLKFIKKAKEVHGNKYYYKKEDYINTKTPMKIFCKKHGYFKQSPDSHKAGKGCVKCNGGITRDKNDFIDSLKRKWPLLFNSGYKILNYTAVRNNVTVQCNNGHIFKRRGQDLTRTMLCPHCSGSHGELLIQHILNDKKINFKREVNLKNSRLRFDFLINGNLAIEYDGEQHFHPVRFGNLTEEKALEKFKKQKDNDKIKEQYCKKNNIKLLRIPYFLTSEEVFFKIHKFLKKNL